MIRMIIIIKVIKVKELIYIIWSIKIKCCVDDKDVKYDKDDKDNNNVDNDLGFIFFVYFFLLLILLNN